MGDTEQQILINDLVINYYKVDRTGDTPSAIFLHGWRSEGKVWLNIMQNLGLQSYALDLPGFGKSAAPSRAYTVSDYAKIVSGFIRKLELKNVWIVGHSFGGRVAIKLAVQDKNQVGKLVLVDAAGFRNESLVIKIKKFVARMAKPLFSLPLLKGLRQRIYQIIGAEDYAATPQLKQTFINIINEDLSPYLSSISQQTLLIWGNNDTDTPLSFARKMRDGIPGARLVILQDAGHFSFLDQPQQFTKTLNKFISA